MLNWRYQTIRLADTLTGKGVIKKYQSFRKLEYSDSDHLQTVQQDKIKTLVKHCLANVPYYRQLFNSLDITAENCIDNFSSIPILTKDIIRQQGEMLYSGDHKKRGSYKNTSGGSTGQPVVFLQDKNYKDWTLAARFYYNYMAGKEIGQKEIKLWGSERDIIIGSDQLHKKLKRWFFNMMTLNSFAMSQENMQEYICRWNRFKPVMVWAYTSSVFELARFAEKNNMQIYPPSAIITTAETLEEQTRSYIESIIKAPVLNQYGSREVGLGGCECRDKNGLHIFPNLNLIEILDDNLKPVPPQTEGNIYITNLNNFAMPLIRYQIGDTGSFADNQPCSCGRSWPRLQKVSGRKTDHFITAAGKIVHGEYFTHLFYGLKDVTRFQVVQTEIELIEINYCGTITPEQQNIICKNILQVMDSDCQIAFNQVNDIPRLASGKHRYTISNVKHKTGIRK